MNRLRAKIVGLLLLVALLPALPAAWAARELIDRVGRPLREPLLVDGAEAGLAATRARLDDERRRFADAVATATPGGDVERWDARRVAALDPAERTALESLPVATPAQVAHPERLGVRGRQVLAVRGVGESGAEWWVKPLPAELVDQAETLSGSLQLLTGLNRGERGAVRSFVAAFVAVYGVSLAVVAGVGLMAATRLTRPLAALAAGIESVAGGDLDTRVSADAGPDVRRLIDAFNHMTTRLRDQREELRKLEKIEAWRQMARRLAHEIKNPLTPIQLAAQEIRDQYPGDDERYRALLTEAGGIIDEEVHGLRDLVTEFSQFARLPQPEFTAVAVNEVVGEVTALYRSAQLVASSDGADAAPGRTATVWCDKKQLHRVLINVINNGLDAQRETGSEAPVELRVIDAGARIALEVADRGAGVDPDHTAQVFEPDFTTKSDGMGLGLAIVKTIVDAHGGTIALSPRDGGGTVVRLELSREGEDRS